MLNGHCIHSAVVVATLFTIGVVLAQLFVA